MLPEEIPAGQDQEPGASEGPRVIGRYVLYGRISSGGMATIHFGALQGPVGFSRTVAIKRLHRQFARDPAFVAMFLDEARIAARIRHPNVVPILDVVAAEGELFLVMDYVQGESLRRLVELSARQEMPLSPRIAAAIFCGCLHGLHAAHETTDERGDCLRVVHRDISPTNILVGVDGIARVLDFGVAQASGRLHTTETGKTKGKTPYLSPEQVYGQSVDRRSDVYSASVCLWEALTGRALFYSPNEGATIYKILTGKIPPPSRYAPDLSPALDEVVMRGLSRAPPERFQTARDMAMALEQAVGIASPSEVAQCVQLLANNTLACRTAKLLEIESQLPRANLQSAEGIASYIASTSQMPPAPLNVEGTRAKAQGASLDDADSVTGEILTSDTLEVVSDIHDCWDPTIPLTRRTPDRDAGSVAAGDRSVVRDDVLRSDTGFHAFEARTGEGMSVAEQRVASIVVETSDPFLLRVSASRKRRRTVALLGLVVVGAAIVFVSVRPAKITSTLRPFMSELLNRQDALREGSLAGGAVAPEDSRVDDAAGVQVPPVQPEVSAGATREGAPANKRRASTVDTTPSVGGARGGSTRTKVTDDCKPAYWIDAAGRKRYKRHCL